MDGHYNSPTFLGQKDSYLLGLTLPQVGLLIGMGMTIFLVSLAIEMDTILRIGAVLGMTAAAGVLLFARISGLSIPVYLLSFAISLFRKPRYEEQEETLLSGDLPWLQAQERRRERTGRWGRLRHRAAETADSTQLAQRRSEMNAEANRQVTQGAVETEKWLREGLESLIKGGGS